MNARISISLSVVWFLTLLVGSPTSFSQERRIVSENRIGFHVYDYSNPKEENKIPILYFHGTSSSKREPDLLIDEIRRKQRVLISFDRPGYGDSAAVHFSSLDDFSQWEAKTLFPAIHKVLGFKPKQFDLVSVSGGAPYALRIMQAKPDRIRKVSLLSAGLFARPVGQEGRYEGVRRLAANRPRVAEWLIRVSKVNPNLTQSLSTQKFSAPDKRFAECHSELHKKLIADASKCGAAGIIQDARLQLCDTSYAKKVPDTVQCEIWNGACDNTISLESAKLLAMKTGVELNVVQKEGHLSSLPISFAKSVLSEKKTD